MATTIDLSEGLWRFHTIRGVIPKDEMPQHPTQTHGVNSDVVLTFTRQSENLSLAGEELSFIGSWFQGAIDHQEDAWDVPQSKGTIRAKVFPAVAEEDARHQVIEIFQTEYHRDEKAHINALTIYTGRLYMPDVLPGKPPSPPIFFGYGADNTGRQWLTFSLTPDNVHF